MTALPVAIAAVALTLLVALRPPPAPDPAWRALDGAWTLDADRSRFSPGGPPTGAASLRIEVDGPLLLLREGADQARTLWIGGPPGATGRGASAGTSVAFRSPDVPVVETGSSSAGRETLRVEPGRDGRLVRTVFPADGGPGDAAVLVYRRTADAAGAVASPALPASAAVAALALAVLAERGLARRTSPAPRRPARAPARSSPADRVNAIVPALRAARGRHTGP